MMVIVYHGKLEGNIERRADARNRVNGALNAFMGD